MNEAARIGTISSSTVAPLSSSDGSGFRDSDPSKDAERLERYRLIIEKVPDRPGYVYKTLDRVTGEVVAQLPREEVLRLRDQPDYVTGKLINTRI